MRRACSLGIVTIVEPKAAGGSSTDDLELDSLLDLRERVLRGSLAALAVAMPGISVVILLQALRHGTLNGLSIALGVYTLSFPLLALSKRWLSFRVGALTLLSLLVFATFIVATRGGVGVGSASVALIVVILGTLFFGRRGAALALCGVVSALVLGAVLVVTESVPPIEFGMWDPRAARYWIRATVGLVLFGVAVAVAQVYVVERLAQNAERFRALAEREQRARLQLEQVEREREAERQRREEAQQALEGARRTEALARLSGGIAHDFNNALTVVFALADLLRTQSCSPEEVERAAGEILAAAESAAELTRQLLTLGRQQVWKPRPVELASFLSRFLRALRRVLPSDVIFDMSEPPKEVVALVDPAHLERACFNLALNARDALPNGGRIRFECVKQTVQERMGLAAGDYVLLSVSDNGEGISAEVREHIFEPFFSTKESGVGSGLGLATVYAFMREAGGDVIVSSTPGRGTTFTLYLPAHTGGELSEGALDAQGFKNFAPPGNRVLVVEDRDDVRKSMLKVLASNGFEVASAPDGDAAMRALESELPFAVMCIDGVMPGTPTARVVEQAQRAWPSLRVLLCSGYVRDDLLRRGIAVGQIAFLAKPFTPQALVASVRGLIGSDAKS